MIEFEQLGCTDELRREFEEACAALPAPAGKLVLGRVTSLDRHLPAVVCAGSDVEGEGERRCELAAAIKKSGDSQVAVGDWVVVDAAPGHEHPVICRILKRRGCLKRVKRVGREGQTQVQVLASGVDRVFVCQSLSGAGVDAGLLVRQMAAVRGCGAECSFVFTKADVAGEEAARAALAQAAAVMPDVEALASPACAAGAAGVADAGGTADAGGAVGGEAGRGGADGGVPGASAVPDDAAFAASSNGGNADESLSYRLEPVTKRLRDACPPGSTALFLGESGVGKSTLVNALVGANAQQTGEVRARDDKGRHTTVARRMLCVPGGGVVIDAPGLRTLQILDLDESLRRAFPDIARLAYGCRFSDCTHTHEPGCAVRGAVPDARLAAYLRLALS